MRTTILFCSILLASCSSSHGHLELVAEQYAQAWYSADGDLMESVLHENFIKRSVVPLVNGELPQDQATAWKDNTVYIHEQDKKVLVDKTRNKSITDPAKRKVNIQVLDAYKNIAVVKVTMGKYTDYLQMAKFEDGWKIVHVLWQSKYS